MPRTGLQFNSSDLVRTAFMILWVAGIAYWLVTGVNTAESSFLFRLFGTVLLVSGLYDLVGRFFVDVWRRRRTFYGITSDRVLVVTEFLSRQSKSRQLDTLPDMTLNQREDGSGTIDFGQMGPDDYRSWLSFRHLNSCAAVYDVVAGARSRAREQRA